MDIDIYQVDSFTLEPFKGNPAGVCISENSLDEHLMLSIAAEMAVSETAFLSLDNMGLRWFTPKVEVNLCGRRIELRYSVRPSISQSRKSTY